jgi:hypothetical protein
MNGFSKVTFVMFEKPFHLYFDTGLTSLNLYKSV